MTIGAPAFLLLLPLVLAALWLRAWMSGTERRETATLSIWRRALRIAGESRPSRWRPPLEIWPEALALLATLMALLAITLRANPPPPVHYLLVERGGSMAAAPRRTAALRAIADARSRAAEKGEDLRLVDSPPGSGRERTAREWRDEIAIQSRPDARFTVLTDRVQAEDLPPDCSIRVVREPFRNAGVTALWTEPGEPAGRRLIVRVEGTGEPAIRGLRVSFAPDGAADVVLEAEVDPATGRAVFTSGGETKGGRLRLLDSDGRELADDLPADDGVTLLAPPAPWRIRVHHPLPLHFDLFRALGHEVLAESDAGPADLTLSFAGDPPVPGPAIRILRPGEAGLPAGQPIGAAVLEWGHPVFAGLALSSLVIDRANFLDEGGGAPLLSTEGGDLARFDAGGRRITLGFDAFAPAWAEKAAFPLFWRALLDLLGAPRPDADAVMTVPDLDPDSTRGLVQGDDREPERPSAEESSARGSRPLDRYAMALGALAWALALLVRVRKGG